MNDKHHKESERATALPAGASEASRSVKPSKPLASHSPGIPAYRSEELFGTGKVIVITHGGREYQLRITSANKLILTA